MSPPSHFFIFQNVSTLAFFNFAQCPHARILSACTMYPLLYPLSLLNVSTLASTQLSLEQLFITVFTCLITDRPTNRLMSPPSHPLSTRNVPTLASLHQLNVPTLASFHPAKCPHPRIRSARTVSPPKIQNYLHGLHTHSMHLE